MNTKRLQLFCFVTQLYPIYSVARVNTANLSGISTEKPTPNIFCVVREADAGRRRTIPAPMLSDEETDTPHLMMLCPSTLNVALLTKDVCPRNSFRVLPDFRP